MLTFILSLGWIALVAPSRSDEETPRCITPTSGGKSPSREDVIGHYGTVSESEWNAEVWLESDGSAEVLSEAWDDRGDHSTMERNRGLWSLSGPFVELRYSGRCESLLFVPALSFAEFGKEGTAPGLQGRHSSVSANLFIGVSLWRVENLRRIPEVQ